MSILTQTPTGVIPSGTWAIDPSHSTVEFTVKHLGLATVRGRALDVTGTIVGGDDPSIEGSVRVAGITTFDETRDGHLQSPDFFDGARHPELLFRSRSVELHGDELVVEGDLTIKGVTKPATLEGTITGPAVDHFGATRVGFKLETVIDRREFDINWNMPLPSGEPALSNDVTLKADLTLVGA